MLNEFLQLILSGIAIGCVYGLVALGFVLIYKATEVVNFAQGELMMFGAFVALTMGGLQFMPFWLSVILAVLAMALIGGAVERAVIRPVLGQPIFSIVMITIGLGFFARGLASLIPGWGTLTHRLPTPYADQTVAFGELVLSAGHLMIILVTAVLCVLLFAFFRFTRMGVAMQAISQNQLAAHYMGIPVARVNTLIWCISAAVAAIAGILLAPITFVHANMGLIGLKAFPAAVIGGFGSIPGAIVGGLIIGIVEAVSGRYLPDGIKDVSAYVVLLAVLIIRPNGLFGEKLTKKV
ncbi:branched-chain amino acid ABC transporter permease [Marinobacter sp.]|uniref:branched-chain amino acid ABC transporter permease n=1 Tax=Marinobacter sp. TaxID=50741 RepID=UPI0035692117